MFICVLEEEENECEGLGICCYRNYGHYVKRGYPYLGALIHRLRSIMSLRVQVMESNLTKEKLIFG